MPDDRKTIVHEWFEQVWNQGNADTIDRLFAEDGVAHGLAGADGTALRGPAGFRPFFQSFRDAFPDIRVDVEDAIVEGDKIAARCVVRGTHLGHGIGLAPTNRPIEITGIVFVRVQDGKIAESWNNFDFALLNAQLATTADAAPED